MDPKARLAELQKIKAARGLTINELSEAAGLLRGLGKHELAAEADRRVAFMRRMHTPPNHPVPEAQLREAELGMAKVDVTNELANQIVVLAIVMAVITWLLWH